MNRDELQLEKIDNKRQEIINDKIKRIGMYIFGLGSVFFTLYLNNNNVEYVWDVLKAILLSIISVILYLYINILIFMPLFYNTQELENVD